MASRIPFRADSAVIGKPDPERTEIVKAFIVLKPQVVSSDELNIKKMCCRRHFLTHVDIE